MMFIWSCSSDDNGEFTISEPDTEPPSLFATAATDNEVILTFRSALVKGTAARNGAGNILQKGICYGLSPNPDLDDLFTEVGPEEGSFESLLTGLPIETQIYVRAYATNANGTSYGDQVQFVTEVLPQIRTLEATNVLRKTARTGAAIDVDDSMVFDLVGVCWSTEPEPTTDDSRLLTTTPIDTVIGGISRLLPETTYYVRAFASNDEVTIYGNEVTFTTDDDCFDGDLFFGSSSQLFAFALNEYPKIDGNLTIDAPNIFDLSELEDLIEVTGDFTVRDELRLNGLDNLTTIGDDFVVRIENLTDFSGMEALTAIGGNLDMDWNPLSGPESLNGLNSLTSIGGDLILGAGVPEDISALSSLSSLDGSLIITNTNSLNFMGLNGLNSIGGDFSVNNSIIGVADYSGLSGLKTIFGDLVLDANTHLGIPGSLNGLNAVVSIGGDIRIVSNDGLNDFCALEDLINLGNYGGILQISGNTYNPTLEDFENGDCSL